MLVRRNLNDVNVPGTGTIDCKNVDTHSPAWPTRIKKNFRDN